MNGFYFTPNGWADYLYWQEQDKKTLRKINTLIKDIACNGYSTIGKHEILKWNLSGRRQIKIRCEKEFIP